MIPMQHSRDRIHMMMPFCMLMNSPFHRTPRTDAAIIPILLLVLACLAGCVRFPVASIA